MPRTQPRTQLLPFPRLSPFLAIFAPLVFLAMPLWAQEAVPPADLEQFMGSWVLSANFNGTPVKLQLQVAEIDGAAKAALKTPIAPEPQLIEEFSLDNQEVDMAFEASFGVRSVRIHVKARREGDELRGNFGDEGGLLSADFTGARSEEPLDLITAALEIAEAKKLEPQRQQRFGGTTAVSLAFGNDKVQLVFGKIKMESGDRKLFEALDTGAVFQYTSARVFKLTNDKDLTFGEITVPTDNLAEDYPGTYGVWLKKTTAGFSLVFNNEPDVWGTMHNPRRNQLEVPLRRRRAPG